MINKNFSIRTDLAMEACELLNTEKDIIDGIKSKTKSDNDIEVTCVEIYNENGSNTVGKPVGKYITVESSKRTWRGNGCVPPR